MKVLKAEFHFALPKDFDGTLADALRLLAAFAEAEHPARDTSKACCGASWSHFEHNLRTASFRFTGKTSLLHLVDGAWERMPQGIVDAVHDQKGASWVK